MDETDAYVDNTQSIKVERGESFEWARLRLLDTKIVDEMLSASEIQAVTAHLKTNFSDCFKLLTDSQLTRLVASTSVSTFPTATQDIGKELPNELLYQKGVPNDAFTLILSGKVTIFVGSENFRADVSSWSVLGKAALESQAWVPDFSAFVSDGPCRCIEIKHSAFAEAVDASVVERRASENKDIVHTMQSGSSFDEGAVSTGESARSDEHVPNRRGPLLARIFNADKSNSDDPDDVDTSKKNGQNYVQFVEGDIANVDTREKVVNETEKDNDSKLQSIKMEDQEDSKSREK